MKKSYIVSILIVVTLFAFTTQASVTVDKTELQFIAGNSIILHYNITGPKSQGSMSINITPDDIGFNLSYNKTFSIPSIQTLRINTNFHLIPGTYIVVATFYTNYQEQSKVTHTYYYTPSQPPNNETSPQDESIIPKENETQEPEPEKPIIETFDYQLLYGIITFITSIIVLCIIILYVRRTNKKQ